ncbi:MAG TPA: plastocyanin/azurin family copper-binding protein [Paludibacter sp.]|nr:plastocyanin/azurin family copper-binding protein [Paludibacter sp.]
MKTINYHSKRPHFIAIALVSVFILLASCTTSNDPSLNEVFIKNMAFTPATLTVTTGTTIKWTNKDGVAHTVTSDVAGQFESGSISTNGVYSHTFSTLGTFNYHCTPHPSMKAKIIVVAASSTNTSNDPPYSGY